MKIGAKMKINIGAGKDWKKDSWSTLGFYSESDISIDLRLSKSLPINDGVCEKLFCSHVIEHLSDENVASLLSECYRVLTFGGVIRLSFPDVEKALNEYRLNNEIFFDSEELLLLGNSMDDKFLNVLSSFKAKNYAGQENYIGGPRGYSMELKDHLDKNDFNIDSLIEWTKTLAPASAYYKAHINGWHLNKIKSFLKDAGFQVILKSSFQNSLDSELRDGLFDNRPLQSLFVEGYKIPSHFSCRNCGNEEHNVFIRINSEFKLPIFKCHKCHFVQTSPAPDTYLSYYYSHLFRQERSEYSERQLAVFRKRAEAQYQYITQFVPISYEMNVADVGAGVGAFASRLNCGNQVIALEPDKNVHHFYTNTSIKLISNQTEFFNSYKNYFHLLTCSHVFEHVIDMDKFLYDCLNTIIDDGVIFIEVPLEDEYYLSSSKCSSKSGHFNHFTLDFIKEYFNNHKSIDVIDISTSGPTLKGYISGSEKIEDHLFVRDDENGIHVRVLLRKKLEPIFTPENICLNHFYSMVTSSLSQSAKLNIELSRLLNHKRDLRGRLKNLDTKIKDKTKIICENEKNIDSKNEEIRRLIRNQQSLESQLIAMKSSTSWKITYPLRRFFSFFFRK